MGMRLNLRGSEGSRRGRRGRDFRGRGGYGRGGGRGGGSRSGGRDTHSQREVYDFPIHAIDRDRKLWIYYYRLPEFVTSRTQKLVLMKEFEKVLKKRERNTEGIVVTINSVISNRILEWMVERIPIPSLKYTISFKEKRLSLRSVSQQVGETIVNDIFHSVISKDPEFIRTWSVNDSNRQYYLSRGTSTREKRATRLEHHFMSKMYHPKFEPKLTPTENSKFQLSIRPSFHERTEYPNALDLIHVFKRNHMRNVEISDQLRSFRVFQRLVRGDTQLDIPIQNVRFNITPNDRVNGRSESILDYYFSKYGKKLEEQGILREDIEPDQPIILLETRGGSHTMEQYVIPQLCRVFTNRDVEPYRERVSRDIRLKVLRESHENVSQFKEELTSDNILYSLELFGLFLLEESEERNRGRGRRRVEDQEEEEEEENEEMEKMREEMKKFEKVVKEQREQTEVLNKRIKELEAEIRKKRIEEDEQKRESERDSHDIFHGINVESLDDPDDLEKAKKEVSERVKKFNERQAELTSLVMRDHQDLMERIAVRIRDVDDLCGICFEREKGHCASPCGHRFCEKCLRNVMRRNKTCPNCRKEIERIIRLF